MSSEGIELNVPEPSPVDPYTVARNRPPHSFQTPSSYDKLKQFMEMDRKVLRFYCVWDDRDNMFGEMKPFVSQIIYIIHVHVHVYCTCKHNHV